METCVDVVLVLVLLLLAWVDTDDIKAAVLGRDRNQSRVIQGSCPVIPYHPTRKTNCPESFLVADWGWERAIVLWGALGAGGRFSYDGVSISGTLMGVEAFSVLVDLAMFVHKLDAEPLCDIDIVVVSFDIVLAENRELFGSVGVVGCGVVSVKGHRHPHQNNNSQYNGENGSSRNFC